MICVAELTVKLVAFVEPNWTAVAPVKFMPVIVTLVPPDMGPLFAFTPVTTGGGKSYAPIDGTARRVTPR